MWSVLCFMEICGEISVDGRPEGLLWDQQDGKNLKKFKKGEKIHLDCSKWREIGFSSNLRESGDEFTASGGPLESSTHRPTPKNAESSVFHVFIKYLWIFSSFRAILADFPRFWGTLAHFSASLTLVKNFWTVGMQKIPKLLWKYAKIHKIFWKWQKIHKNWSKCEKNPKNC